MLTKGKTGIKKETYWNPLASHRQDYRNPMAKAVLNSIQNNPAVVSQHIKISDNDFLNPKENDEETQEENSVEQTGRQLDYQTLGKLLGANYHFTKWSFVELLDL
mgnify:CR=1 FL=1